LNRTKRNNLRLHNKFGCVQAERTNENDTEWENQGYMGYKSVTVEAMVAL